MTETPPIDCNICYDSGMEIVPGYDAGGARPCRCRLAKVRAQALARIPLEFQDCSVKTLTPNITRHPKQARYIPLVKQHPEDKYFICGRPGTGKSRLLWSLYAHAVEQGTRRVVACTLQELINDYKKVIEAQQNGQPVPRIRLESEALRQRHTQYAIFLDDIDKARATAYVAELVFDLIDAIHSWNHQLVVTTNIDIEALVKLYNRADRDFGQYGEALGRRFYDNARVVEMF